ncbi:hypothetical protein CL630_03940 [bacterium]|nr:hypothetical protein [bacterium]|tara:strand:- start:69932 stop:71167 length:1236 start_codon:yes stop_codon:yes gene_type:complete
MSEFLLNFIYNPATAIGIASVALIVSLYVLYMHRVPEAYAEKENIDIEKIIALTKDGALNTGILRLGLAVLFVGGIFFVQGQVTDNTYGNKIEHIGVTFEKTIAAIVAIQSETSTTSDMVTEEADEDAVEVASDPLPSVPEPEPEPVVFIEPIIIPEPEPIIVVPEPAPEPEPEVIEAQGPAPDFTVYALSRFGTTLEEGNVTSFSVVVLNDGEEDVHTPFNSQLFIDEFNDGIIDVYRKRIQTPLIMSEGEDTKIWKSAWAQKAGTHRVEVCTDVDNVILETNEKNNCTSIIFEVKGPSESGDLVVEQILITPQQPSIGERVLFFAHIKNIANTKVGGSYVDLYVDNLLRGRQYVTSILGGTFEEVEWNGLWRASATGSYEYTICADGKKEVSEANEENNCSSGTITISE